MRGQQLKKVNWNAHKELSDEPGEEIQETEEQPKRKTVKTMNNRASKPIGSNNQDEQVLQIKKYIAENIFPSLNLTTNGKLKFLLNDDSIKSYVSLLPFNPEDYPKYQKNPIEIQGYIQDAAFLGEIANIQNAFNNHVWVKGACLRLSILFMPVLDETASILI